MPIGVARPLIVVVLAVSGGCAGGGAGPSTLDVTRTVPDVATDTANPGELRSEEPASEGHIPVDDSSTHEAASHVDTKVASDGCKPICQDKQCGDDGCGGFCGGCAANEMCESGMCVCQPLCGEVECGVDGCGGSCGDCAVGETCKAGQCVCLPSCDESECGPDGCGGECGQCRAYEGCVNGMCKPLYGQLGDSCSQGAECESGLCLTAGSGKICTKLCTPPDCPAGFLCDSLVGEGGEELQVCLPCTPKCTGKVCGSDGCGDICGVCEFDEYCAKGQCATLTGEFGKPCVYGSDCDSWVCINSTQGKFCSMYCTIDADCPPGYSCEIVSVPGGETAEVCLP